jgi:hypothetical protein
MNICLYSVALVLIGFLYFYFRFKIRIKNLLSKIDDLASEIIKTKQRKETIKMLAYHKFFMAVNHIYTHFKPYSISVYYYDKKKELNTTIMNFLYQIKDGKAIFKGKYNNIPITNINTVSEIYFSNKVMSMQDIKEMCHYDSGLYEHLEKQGVQKMYLINIYSEKKNKENIKCLECDDCTKNRYGICKKNKPIGFLILTYKETNISSEKKTILVKETLKVSEPLSNIIK